MKRKSLLLLLVLALGMPWAMKGQITTTTTCYPPSQTYATGYTSTTEKTSGEMHAVSGGGVQGWMKFDVSAIPDNATINSITLKFYTLSSTNNCWVKLTAAGLLDPVTASADALYSAIITESPNYFTNTYMSGFGSTPTWKEFGLSDAAKTNLQNIGLANDFFTIGFYEYESSGYQLYTAGYNDATYGPYIEVNYTYTPTDPFIYLSPESATVLTTYTQTLTASYLNVTGTPTITYFSNNTSVATVSGSGTSATVTAVSPGSATITATMPYGGTNYTATCDIMVEDYCTPGTGNYDNDGIYNVTFGTSPVVNNTVAGIAYGDYSNLVGGVIVGTTCQVDITYHTGYTYGTIVWVDWNHNHIFEGTEAVYAGESGNANPTTLNATFTVPATTQAGDYRMRIIGADQALDDYVGSLSAAANVDPCGSFNWSTCHDYTIRVLPFPTKIVASNPNAANDEMTWTEFADLVNSGVSYYGKTVTLEADINVSTMVGTESHPFTGTFDGQGHTLNVSLGTSSSPITEQGAAAFHYINGANIQKLVVTGDVYSNAHHAAGLVGFATDGSTNVIWNCHVSTNVTNDNAYAGDGGSNYMGGFIGHNMAATLIIEGCVYDGTLTSQGFKGGMVGFGNYNSNVTIINSYFDGDYSTNGYSDDNFSPIACHGSGRNFNFTFSNFYYNKDIGTFTAPSYEGTVGSTYTTDGRAKHGYTISATSPVTVAMSGTALVYTTSNITYYHNGDPTLPVPGLIYNGNIIAGEGDQVGLNLTYGGTVGGGFVRYSATNGTLNPTDGANGSTTLSTTLTKAANETVISGGTVYTLAASANPTAYGYIQGITGDGGTITNSCLPGNTLYNNTLSQQIFTPVEIGFVGTINSIAFFNGGSTPSNTPNFKFYLTHTNKTSFNSSTDWITVTASDLVYEHDVNLPAGQWTILTLDTPFEYDGTSNLALITDLNMVWSSGLACRVFTGEENCSMYIYSDGTNYDPYNPSGYSGTRTNQKNQIVFNPTSGSSFSKQLVDGSTFALAAIPFDNHGFLNWTEDGNVVSTDPSYQVDAMHANRTLVANFAQVFPLYFTVSPQSSGYIYVTQGSNNITSGNNVAQGATLNIRVSTYSGYTFDHWEVEGQGASVADASSATTTLTMGSEETSLTAVCTISQYAITVTSNNDSWGTVSGGGNVVYGQECTITATPTGTSQFLYWKQEGSDYVTSYDASYSFTAWDNISYVAYFLGPEHTVTVTADPEEAGNIIFPVSDGSSMNDYYLPSNSNWYYCLTQQIYTPAEIGTLGALNSIAFYNEGTTVTRTYDIYLVHTNKTVFESSTDWIAVSASDLVFSGNVTMTSGQWTTITLDTPFAYNGTSNLAIIMFDYTYSWNYGMTCRVFVGSENCSLYTYQDGSTPYDPTNPSGYSGNLSSFKNQLLLDFSTSSVTKTYHEGAECTLVTTPNDPNYTFSKWINNGNDAVTTDSYTFTVGSTNHTVLAQYAPDEYTLTINYQYSNGNTAAPTHTESIGYHTNYNVESPTLTGYTPDIATVTGTMGAQNETVTVTYTPNNYEITATANPAAGGTITHTGGTWSGNTGTYSYNTSCTVTTTVNAGYTFDGWYEGNTLVESNTSYTFTVVADRNLEARFTQNQVTITKTIIGHDDQPGRWYLITSPLNTGIAPTAVTNMIPRDGNDQPIINSVDYDLFYFDQAATDGLEWRNFKDEYNSFTELVPGTGYLYANKETVILEFTGVPYQDNGIVTLRYSEDNQSTSMRGWNLVGNPLQVEASLDCYYYVMNDAGTEIVLIWRNIAPMEGVFVKCETDGSTVTFNPVSGSKNAALALNVTQGRGLVDCAAIGFDNKGSLPKFQLNPNHTKVYIPKEDKDYAVVMAESDMGELPVNFKAEKNGTYTIRTNAVDVAFGYLHLIDNLTGADVDLLANPSYSFNATTTDYASRFRLVFATANSDDDNFGFYNGSAWVINNDGEAILQVVDVMGRILKSESINGCATVNFNAAPGVYMLRLINGDNERVQKIVVR